MSANKNPFFDDEEVDDDTFINYNRSRAYDNAEAQVYQQKQQKLLEERREIENRMLQSSNSAVRVLYETEGIGVETATELVRQGEQLKKIDNNLDEINSTMRTTQKHLTAMKSYFSGVKSFFGRSNTVDGSTTSSTRPSSEEKRQSALTNALDKVRDESQTARQNNHPALRNHADTSGFGAAFEDERGVVRNGQTNSTKPPLTRSQMVDQKVDQDLTELSHGLGRLKCLAQGLSTELDDQLDLMKGIDDKVSRADVTITFQNNQMNRLLKK